MAEVNNKESNLDKRITDAMHRIEELYYETDGKCYVSFSGGKDSTVLLALVKMCEDILTIPKDSIPAVFSNTGVELGVTVDFVKWVKENWYPRISERMNPKIVICGARIRQRAAHSTEKFTIGVLPFCTFTRLRYSF